MADTLNDIERRKLLQEYERRQRLKDRASDQFKATEGELRLAQALREQMFPKQRAFFEDPARRKVGFCTRRAGKTIGVGHDGTATLLENPNALLLYMAQTLEACRTYIWRELKMLVAKYNLPFEFNENSLTMKHTRGTGMLILKGADNEKAVDKLRGPKWLRVYLDESGHFGAFMENLIVEVIGPALRDQNGTLILIGTAGRKQEGLFYEAAHGIRKNSDGTPIFKVHRWSLQDNPFLSEDAKNMDLIMAEEGFTAEDPRFLREYMGVWAASDTERVWSGYSAKKNDCEVFAGSDLPREHKWEFLIGADFGWADENALVVLAYARTTKTIYVLESWGKARCFTDEIAAKMMEFRGKYGARRIVGDCGSHGGVIIQKQLARDYGIYVEAAKKTEKYTYIEFMNSALRRGDLLIARGDAVAKEFLEVAWDETKTKIGNHEKDNRGMATTYGWRAAYNLAGTVKPPERSATNNPDKARASELAEKTRALNEKPKQAGTWWDNDSSGTDSSVFGAS